MKRRSFASRLSLKIVLVSSLIFLAAIVAVAIRGTALMEKMITKYGAQTMRLSAQEIQLSMRMVENTVSAMAMTVEEFRKSDSKIDTASMFDLMERIVKSREVVLGLGIYFEPGKAKLPSNNLGIYVSQDPDTGVMGREWENDATIAEKGNYLEAEWYTKAKEERKGVWSSPYIDEIVNGREITMTTFSYPMLDDDGSVFAILNLDMSLEWIKAILEEKKPFPHTNLVLVDENFNIICNPLSDTPFTGSIFDQPVVTDMDFVFKPGFDDTVWYLMDEAYITRIKYEGKAAYCGYRYLENGWEIFVTNHSKDIFESLESLWHILALITILGLLILFHFCRHIIHNLSRPIGSYAEAASKITDGRFDVAIPKFETNDEIEDLGNALTYMQESVTKYIEELETTTAEKERLESELDVARKIQMQMLCKKFPSIPGCGINAFSSPAHEVGGDLYDFFVNGDDLYFIVGDVSGKGVPAALLMAITIAAFRAAGKKGHSSAEIVALINNTFCKSNEDMMFVTLVTGKINVKTGEMEFCNGGHNPMLLIPLEGNAGFVKSANNLACGVLADFTYASDSLTIQKGSRLVIYSDGITEAEDKSKQQYGDARLLEWAKKASTEKIPSDYDAVKSLLQSVTGFTSGAEQNDDMTIMSISL